MRSRGYRADHQSMIDRTGPTAVPDGS